MEQEPIKTRAELNKSFFDELSEIGKELFCEFFSETSRNRQVHLFTSALATILITFAFITLTEGEVKGPIGIQFSVQKSELFPLLSASVCLYFLITYLLSVAKDYQQLNYKTLPALNRLNALSEKLDKIKWEHEKIILETGNELQELSENRENLRTRFAELNQRVDAEFQDIQNLADATYQSVSKIPLLLRKLLKRGTVQEGEEIKGAIEGTMELQKKVKILKDIRAAFQQMVEQVEQRTDQAKIDDLINAKQEYNQLLSEFSLDYFREKTKLLEQTRKKYKTVNDISTILEVVFPVALSLFSIGSAIWEVFKK